MYSIGDARDFTVKEVLRQSVRAEIRGAWKWSQALDLGPKISH